MFIPDANNRLFFSFSVWLEYKFFYKQTGKGLVVFWFNNETIIIEWAKLGPVLT